MTLLTEIRTAATGSPDDRALIRRIIHHIGHHSTDVAELTWHEPVQHYLSLGAPGGRVERCPPHPPEAVLAASRAP